MPIDQKRLAPVKQAAPARTTYSLKVAGGNSLITSSSDYLKAKY